jgi:predicted Zn finger-like uncharacterized protein
MYTRCPECSTVFHVTAAQLRAASGDVLCGGCAIAFNALKYLMDELPSADDDGPHNHTSSTPASPGFESRSDMNAPDRSRQDTPVEDTGGSLEFDAPQQTWGSMFIGDETDSSHTPSKPESVSEPGLKNADTKDDRGDAEWDLETATGSIEEWEDMLAELPADSKDEPVFIVADEEGSDGSQVPRYPEHTERSRAADAVPSVTTSSSAWHIGDEESAPATPITDPHEDGEAGAGSDYAPAPATDAVSAADAMTPPPWITDQEVPESGQSPARDLSGQRGWWVGAAALLLTLIGQLVHANRDTLAASARYGPGVRQLYASLGLILYPEWDLASYAVRGSEAIAGPAESNSLQVIARVEVGGRNSVGIPLIRVVLQDRWSNTVASGVFYPDEYLAGMPEVPAMVGPGNAIPVRIRVIDPGAQAQGYVVDVCLPRRYTGLECQNARNPFQQ